MESGFLNGDAVRKKKKKDEVWYVVSKKKNKYYEISSSGNVGKIIIGAEVKYQNFTWEVVNWVSDSTVRLKKVDDGRMTTAKVEDIKGEPQQGGTPTILTVHENDIEASPQDTYKTPIYVYTKHSTYVKRMNEMLEDIEEKGGSDHYKKVLKFVIEKTKGKIKDKDTWWFGDKMPKTYKEMMERETFQEMDKYHKFKEEMIRPIIEKLKKKTFADILQENLTYNDRKIGVFDFSRASINLLERFIYYSVKHKKIVKFDDVYIYKKSSNKYVYKLKEDNSEVVLKPMLDKKGKPKYSSTIKKSYLYKEKLPRPNNAVRIFLLVGGNADVGGEKLMFPALAGIAITEILELLGYAVNLNAGFADELTLNTDEGYKKGARFSVFPLKRFDEKIDVSRMLYITADPSYFRSKVFSYFVGVASKFKDKIDTGLGYMADQVHYQNAVYKYFLPKDKNKGVQYWFITGKVEGKDFYSEEGIMQVINEIVLGAEESNKQARDKMQLKTL